MQDKVSIVMPLYNAEKYVDKTIDCMLNQTYKNIELIIVDDASTDSSLEIVLKKRDSRIKLLRNEYNRGISFSRNRAIKEASGVYIAIMDDDDLAPLDRIEKEVEFLDKNPGVHIVLGHMVEIDEDDNPCSHIMYSYLNPKYLRARQLFHNCIPNGSTLIRKEFIDSNNLKYKEQMFGAEDYRFWVECLVKGAKFATLDEVLLYHRIHGHNASILATKYNTEERERVIREIKRTALAESGFSLSDKHYSIIFNMFKEYNVYMKDVQEIELLYEAFRSITSQAYEMNMDNAKEIEIACRKCFGEKIGNAFFLWE